MMGLTLSWKWKLAGGIAALCVASEFVLRAILGCAPLSVMHPTIEYMFAPNQQCMRFGNEVSINEYGMRSPPVSQLKQENELRVLILGDSVINGGNSIDQSELATTLVQRSLAEALSRPVLVMNVSAGSWGPANLLAYIENFGTFDAEVAVVVLSTHDYADAPTFAALNPNTHPTQAPALAIREAITRYAPRLFARLSPDGKIRAPKLDPTAKTVHQSIAAFEALASKLKRENSSLFFVLHSTRSEVAQGHYDEEAWWLINSAQSSQIPVLRDLEEMTKAQSDGKVVYQDDIHLSVEGQKVLSELLIRALSESIATRPRDPSGSEY